MSWQAQTAVNHCSKQSDFKLFKLLMYLAEGADSEGIIDPAPSQDTLAEFCNGVSDRTVRTYLSKLMDSGELKQIRVGSGPGNPSAYQINLTMSNEGGRKVEDFPVVTSTFIEAMGEMSALITGLKVEINALKVEVLELKVEKVEAKGGNPVKELGADDPYFDPYFDPEEEEEKREDPPSPQTAVQIWERVTGNWPGEIRTGIITDGMGDNPDEDALKRAYRFWIGRGYSPVNVDGILEWYQLCRASPSWQPNGKYKQGVEPKIQPRTETAAERAARIMKMASAK